MPCKAGVRLRLGFLGAWLFCRESHAYEGWNSLEILGFSRLNLDLSMGYEGKSRKGFSRALPWREVAGTVPRVRKGAGLDMGQAYPGF